MSVKCQLTSEWIQNDADYPDSLGNAMRDEFSMKLTFTDFYNGKRKIIRVENL